MMRAIPSFLLQSFLVLSNVDDILAFQSSLSSSVTTKSTTSSPTRLKNFFKDLLDSAFENDSNLPSDKTQNQLEGPLDEPFNIFSAENEKTDVQKRWLESQSKTSSNSAIESASGFSSSTSSSKGAPINPDLLIGTKWELSLYLVGSPDFDPNNSLYGSKVNISTRKDSNMAKEGFAIGADSLPSDPSTTCTIQLLDNQRCQIDDGSFTNSFEGEWILSGDQRSIRFSMIVKGFQRTITTLGTIQNVSWSDREEVSKKSSATYSIAPGLIYAEASIGYGNKPGLFVMATGDRSNDPNGLLKVEKRMGAFGVSSKMVACGKFSSNMIID